MGKNIRKRKKFFLAQYSVCKAKTHNAKIADNL